MNKITIHEEREVLIEENEQDRIEGKGKNENLIFYVKKYDYKNPDVGDGFHLSKHMEGLVMSALKKVKSKEESMRFYEIHKGEFEVCFEEIPGIKLQNLTIVPKKIVEQGKSLSPQEIIQYEKTKISIPLKNIFKKRYGYKR